MAPRRRRQVRELVEQQGESKMPSQGQVQEEVPVEESVAQPQVAPVAAPVAGQDRDTLKRRDQVVTATAAVIPSRPGHDGLMRRDFNRETGETSQQRQGARRAEETGR
ncbi:hypothetical protein Taro_023908 [Colocasia esculenta]|uniref:Uncharacterized protein n=1 Tax=Colocasia esculenta TaxID=4460 RepID=A0A843VIQ3_COLES|nr:hypothetical protein [Colocasia esculenta]